MGGKSEDQELMLAGIQHFQFCKRQWALIHIEQQWEENARTMEGQYLHRNADQAFTRERRGNKLIARAMPVQSRELNITGVCDVVEFVRDPHGVEIYGEEGTYTAYPVEYKRGKPKWDDADILQLTAQAVCLEEMLLCDIHVGYLYYHEVRRRVEIPLTAERKEKVKQVYREMNDLYGRRHTPKVKTGAYCRNCSLQHICLPRLSNIRNVSAYIKAKIEE